MISLVAISNLDVQLTPASDFWNNAFVLKLMCKTFNRRIWVLGIVLVRHWRIIMCHWKICKYIIKVDLHVIFDDSRQLPRIYMLVVVILETMLGWHSWLWGGNNKHAKRLFDHACFFRRRGTTITYIEAILHTYNGSHGWWVPCPHAVPHRSVNSQLLNK